MHSFKIFHSKSLLLIAFILSFMYLIEISLGVRTVIYAFQRFRSDASTPTSETISWAAAVLPLLLSMMAFMTVSCLSLYWSLEVINSAYKSIYYSCHIIVGGILWRYVGLFRCESVEKVKDEAILLASLKFLFTQLYSIPLFIIHIFLHENPYEFLYDVIVLCCIVITLILTCSTFNRHQKTSEFPHETMELVPLLFLKPVVDDSASPRPKKFCFVNPQVIWRVAAATQSAFFTFGRILALGVLLKLAGVYAITIILLQFLISILYLKFHATSLVPDILKKSKQLIRLSFLSYVLLFEWQLSRNPTTGYNLETKAKHGMLYYTIATVESMFYLIAWAIAECQSSVKKFGHESKERYEYTIVVSTMGCLCLVISYAIHLSILLFKVIPCMDVSIKDAVGTRFRRSIGHLCCKGVKTDEKNSVTRTVPKIDITSISDQIEEKKHIDTHNDPPEADYGSYRDLKENINYESGGSKTSSPIQKKSSKMVGYPKHLFRSSTSPDNSKSDKPGVTSSSLDPEVQVKSAKSSDSLVLKISKRTRDYVKRAKHDDETQRQQKDSPGPSRKIRHVVQGISPKFDKLKNLTMKRILPKLPMINKKELSGKVQTCETLKIPTIMNEYGSHELKQEDESPPSSEAVKYEGDEKELNDENDTKLSNSDQSCEET